MTKKLLTSRVVLRSLLVFLMGFGHFFHVNTTKLQAQTVQTTFGKNRVQYHSKQEEWMYYVTENFTTYWYGDARNVAQFVLQSAEADYDLVRQYIDYQPSDRIDIIVFTDYTDVKQSNIGSEDLLHLKLGETTVMGSKVFVHFDGNHQHLRAQIREGVAKVLLQGMVYGSNITEIVQNAVLLNLPTWFTDGFAAFCGEEWSTKLDNELKDVLFSKKYTKFDKLARDHPRLAGHALCYFIHLHYGKNLMSNLMYMIRSNHGLDSGFRYGLGTGYGAITTSALEYFNKRYEEDSKIRTKPDEKDVVAIKLKKKHQLTSAKISPDGKRVAYVKNNIGKWKVLIKNLESGKTVQAMEGGTKNNLQSPDLNYPLIAWSPDNISLGIIHERRDLLYYTVYDTQTRSKLKEALSPEYQRVYSMDFINPVEMVLSAAVQGYGDLFIYRTMTRQSERLTQDFWDDLDASVATLDGEKGVVFASNRHSDTLQTQKIDTILPLGNYDIFFFNLENRSKELTRLSNTPESNEYQPIAIDSSHFTFISDAQGLHNRNAGYLVPYKAYHLKVIHLKDGTEVKTLNLQKPGEWSLERTLQFYAPFDTVMLNVDKTQIDSISEVTIFKKKPITYQQTNYDRNILSLSAAPRAGKIIEMTTRHGKSKIIESKIQPNATVFSDFSRFRKLSVLDANLQLNPNVDSIKKAPEVKNLESEGTVFAEYRDSLAIIPNEMLFQVPEHLRSTIDQKEAKITQTQPTEVVPLQIIRDRAGFEPKSTAAQSIHLFNPSRIIPYRKLFRNDFITTTMDNGLLFDGLDSYAGTPQGFTPPPPGILVKANFKELMENIILEAGFRLPTTFNGAEYYVWLLDKKKRIDKKYSLYRRTSVQNVGQSTSSLVPTPIRVRTNTTLGQYEMRYPFNMFTSLRATATVRQDRNITASTDNTTLNVPDFKEQRVGLRLTGIYDNSIDVDINIKHGTRAKIFVEGMKKFELNTDPKFNFNFNAGYMGIVGIDARHYIPLDRISVLALRFAGTTTFGTEKILYYLGGIDNWVFPKFDNTIPVPQDLNIGFETQATNLRGFKQNIRNGNSYAVFNSEVRLPVFKYLFRQPTLSNFWRSIQLVGFLDAGVAWTGLNPFKGNNLINTAYLYNPPTISVKVNYFRDPLVAGYGAGLRMKLFGMFLRFDYGWGIETRVIQKPNWYLGLGTDF